VERFVASSGLGCSQRVDRAPQRGQCGRRATSGESSGSCRVALSTYDAYAAFEANR
jgi:hypothetical protein